MPVLGALPMLGPWSLAGRPLPLGATACDGGVNFAIYSSCATAAVLCLFTISDLKTAVISREEYGIPGPGGHCWPQMTGMIPVLKNEVKLNSMLNHTARINCLAWSLDSHLIATGSLDTCVIIYELGKPASSLITIKGAHQGGVYGIAFIDENSLASAREDACVRVWTLTPQ